MGKGDGRRPTQVQDAVFTDNWCIAFGHKARNGICLTCGLREQPHAPAQEVQPDGVVLEGR